MLGIYKGHGLVDYNTHYYSYTVCALSTDGIMIVVYCTHSLITILVLQGQMISHVTNSHPHRSRHAFKLPLPATSMYCACVGMIM